MKNLKKELISEMRRSDDYDQTVRNFAEKHGICVSISHEDLLAAFCYDSRGLNEICWDIENDEPDEIEFPFFYENDISDIQVFSNDTEMFKYYRK